MCICINFNDTVKLQTFVNSQINKKEALCMQIKLSDKAFAFEGHTTKFTNVLIHECFHLYGIFCRCIS